MSALTLLEMAERMAAAAVATREAANAGLEQAAIIVEKAAKDKFGEYQEAVGPFPEWAELAESTQEERERLGFTPNDPLLRRGDLRDSFKHQTGDQQAVIGSTSPIMAYQEFGTDRIPPRPVVGPAALESHGKIKRILGSAVVSGIVGRDPIHPSLGYDARLAGE